MNKILEIIFGSHLYGVSTPTSDLDLKAIYLPTAKEVILNNYKKTITTVRPKQPFERNTKDDVDIEIFSLDRYLHLLMEGQTLSLDFLFHTPDMITHKTKDYWIFEYIFNNREKFLSKDVTAFIGYAKNQAAKYGLKGFRVHALRTTLEFLKSYEDKVDIVGDCDLHSWVLSLNNEHIKIVECKGAHGKMEPHLEVCGKKTPFHARIGFAIKQIQRRFDEYGQRALMAENNEGCDYKALSHAVRVNSEAKELLLTGKITFPRPDRELLLRIKKGEIHYKEVAEIIENGLEELKECQKISILRDKPDVEFAEDFIFEVYSNIVKKTV